MSPIRSLLIACLLVIPACAPCAYDNGIVSGVVTDSATGDPAEAGRVEFTITGGAPTDVGVFGDGLFEASLPAGEYQVVAWNDDDTCFSAISTITVAACDELELDLSLIDCF